MEQEPHIIRRQLLELVTGDTTGSYALQDEVALLYNELVLPMIDRCFSEVSARRHIAPIDLLELDLGTIDRNNLRSSFLQKAEAALRKKLAEIGGSAVRFEDTDSFAKSEDSTSLPEPACSADREGTREVTRNDLASVPTISAEDRPVNTTAPHHGKTFHFNVDDDSEDETPGIEVSEGTGEDVVPLILPINAASDWSQSSSASDELFPSKREDGVPYQGKTIEFNVEDDTVRENKFINNEVYTDDVTENVTRLISPLSAEQASSRGEAYNDQNSDSALKEDQFPFDGQTIHFNSEKDSGAESDHEEMYSDDVADENATHLIPPLSAEQAGSKGEDDTHLRAVAERGVFDEQTSSDSSSRTPISLIRFYLRTGLFPWWARDTSREAFERAVRECILAGKDLPQLVALLNRSESLQRFTTLPDEVVRAVAVAISPMNEATLSGMQPSWEKLLPAGRLSARQHWWITVFSAAAARRLTQAKAYDPAETIAAFLEPYPEQPTEAREKKYRNTYSKRLSLLEKFFSHNGFTTETTRLRTVHELLSKKGNGTEELQARQWSAVHDRLLNGQDVSEGFLPLAADSAGRERASQPLPAAEAQLTSLPKAQEPVINYMEKIFIDNAGLVLFWPYLASFFERLELTEENRFKDAVSQEKAMIALEILAYGHEHTPFFEASLPLNKVLCGVLPETPVNTDHPFRKTELKTIDGLLAAVMQQSEIGKNLSATGFREAWLQRKGALSVRDGHWLLQVERKTYDVLLDSKLPWGIRIVKLPWMDNLLTVEW